MINASNQKIEYQEEKYVTSGKLVTGSRKGLICTSPLGSCVAVISYDKYSKIGGIAHVMLPGETVKDDKDDKDEENKFTVNAITNLIKELTLLGASETNLEFCIVGGANVLKKENDQIAKNVRSSVNETLKQRKLIIKKASLGGYKRRSASLNLSSGVVNYKVGNGAEKLFFEFTDSE